LELALKIALVGFPQALPNVAWVTSKEPFACYSPSSGFGEWYIQPDAIIQIRHNIGVEQSDAF
jgi:hypothetical protein